MAATEPPVPWWQKSTMATLVAGVVVVGALVYGFWTQNTQLVTLVGGAGIGYLFGRSQQ